MSYLDMVNRFWNIDECRQFSCCETRLYFYLLKTANRLGWENSWMRSDTRVSTDVGVSASVMKRARNLLVQAGLIEVKPGGKGQRDKTKYTFRYQNLIPKCTPKQQPKSCLYVRNKDKDIDKDKEEEISSQESRLFAKHVSP